jgi:hypothetical protein
MDQVPEDETRRITLEQHGVELGGRGDLRQVS